MNFSAVPRRKIAKAFLGGSDCGDVAAVVRNFETAQMLCQWKFFTPIWVCLSGGSHGWNHLSRRPDRRHHVHSFFSRSALGRSTL